VLKQLDLIKMRNSSTAFNDKIRIGKTTENILEIKWQNGNDSAHLKADLSNHTFTVELNENGVEKLMPF
jgi:sucrose phosphorylase